MTASDTTPPRRRSLCVYCGARTGTTPAHAAAARELGRLIGEHGWRLVYGGGNVGLMGLVADAALAAGAPVLGIIPDSLMRREVGHPGLTELQVVTTMHERKQSGSRGYLTPSPHTTHRAGPQWAVQQAGSHDEV